MKEWRMKKGQKVGKRRRIVGQEEEKGKDERWKAPLRLSPLGRENEELEINN